MPAHLENNKAKANGNLEQNPQTDTAHDDQHNRFKSKGDTFATGRRRRRITAKNLTIGIAGPQAAQILRTSVALPRLFTMRRHELVIVPPDGTL